MLFVNDGSTRSADWTPTTAGCQCVCEGEEGLPHTYIHTYIHLRSVSGYGGEGPSGRGPRPELDVTTSSCDV